MLHRFITVQTSVESAKVGSQEKNTPVISETSSSPKEKQIAYRQRRSCTRQLHARPAKSQGRAMTAYQAGVATNPKAAFDWAM